MATSLKKETMRPPEPIFHDDETVLASWKCKGLLLSPLDYEGDADLIGPEELLVSTGPVAFADGYLGGLVNTWMLVWEVELDWQLIATLLEQVPFPTNDEAIAAGLYIASFAACHGAPSRAKQRINNFLKARGLPQLSPLHALCFWAHLIPWRWSKTSLPGMRPTMARTERFMMRAYPFSHDWQCLRHGVYQPRMGFGADRKVGKPMGWIRPPGKQPYTETGG